MRMAPSLAPGAIRNRFGVEQCIVRTRYPKAVALVLLAVLSASCGGGEAPDGEKAETEAGSVVMSLIAFKPERLSVPAGTTVKWRQDDAGFHTVTSGTVQQESSGVTDMPDGRFSSGQLATGKTFEFRFDTPGTFPYYCEIHPATMRGEISVT